MKTDQEITEAIMNDCYLMDGINKVLEILIEELKK